MHIKNCKLYIYNRNYICKIRMLLFRSVVKLVGEIG